MDKWREKLKWHSYQLTICEWVSECIFMQHTLVLPFDRWKHWPLVHWWVLATSLNVCLKSIQCVSWRNNSVFIVNRLLPIELKRQSVHHLHWRQQWSRTQCTQLTDEDISCLRFDSIFTVCTQGKLNEYQLTYLVSLDWRCCSAEWAVRERQRQRQIFHSPPSHRVDSIATDEVSFKKGQWFMSARHVTLAHKHPALIVECERDVSLSVSDENVDEKLTFVTWPLVRVSLCLPLQVNMLWQWKRKGVCLPLSVHLFIPVGVCTDDNANGEENSAFVSERVCVTLIRL